MAAPMAGKVNVEFDVSDSDPEGEIQDSSGSDEENDANNSAGEENETVENSAEGKTGLADVLAKILHKNVPSHKQVILSKGKTDKEIQKRKLEREEAEEEKKSAKLKTETRKTEPQIAREEKLKLWENMCRSKPDPLDREKERKLQKVATRGVVQLFNAVRKQQKEVEEEIQQVGSSERKKDKIMEGMTKDKFLNILKGTNKTNVISGEKPQIPDPKTIHKDEESESDSEDDNKDSGKTWKILKDDYMMGAKMKDWDKQDSDDEDDDDSGPDDPDLSDSD